MTKEVKDKSLNDKAIDIKGKKYVLVADRILYFNEAYPNGSIETSFTEDDSRITFTAVVFPNVDKPMRRFFGHSQAVWGDGYINKTSALENAETSAVGRALAFMGIGVIESIASVDEIKKAQNTEKVIDQVKLCPDCEAPEVFRKNGNGSYCKNKYNGACPPKPKTEADKKISAEVDSWPEPDWSDIPTIEEVTIDDIK